MQVPIKTGGTGEQREVFPKGSYPAVIVGLIDLGTHNQQKYQSEEWYERRTVFVIYELTTKTLSGTNGQSALRPTFGQEYTLSMDPKAKFRILADALLSADKITSPFNPDVLLGVPCVVALTVGESAKGNSYNRIDNVAPPIEGMPVVPPQTPPWSWWLDDGTPMAAGITAASTPYVFGVPAKERIETSHEWQARGRNGQKPPQTAQAPRSAPPSSTPPSRPKPPPRATQTPAKAAGPSGQFWCDLADGKESELWPAARIQVFITEHPQLAASMQLCREGSETWLPPAHAGFTVVSDPVPF